MRVPLEKSTWPGGSRRAGASALFPRIVREQHRRMDPQGPRVLSRLGPEPREVLQRQIAVLHGLGSIGSRYVSLFVDYHGETARKPHLHCTTLSSNNWLV